MAPAVQTALKALHQALQALYGDRLVRIVLYGSHARGEATPDSDVDVMVILRGSVQPLRELRRMSAIATDLSLEHELLISLLPISETTVEAGELPLLREIQAEGVVV
ncbi:MAG: nucleotidyltransferase domain-containing protein [Bacteroidetes bacterium]|jgi:predicted nucleotidyltransferase|nr:nucleotidyltransferase domain-containing protein [Bacteroidota bacterium]